MSDSEKTEEQKAAEAAAAAQKKAEKDEATRLKKEQKAAEAAAKKEAKAAEKAAKEQEKKDAAAAKAAEKAAAAEAKKANQMPESNGVRRPKPDTLCGKAWAIFDEISAKNGSAASIAEALKVSNEQGLNEGNVKAEYARWRKFFGVSGRIPAPSAPAPDAQPTQ